MHHSEWLKDAQAVPVGQQRRIYHGAERRANLVVWNNPDSWSCYCHSCHEGARVFKEVLQKPSAEAAPEFRKYLSSSDCCTLTELARRAPEKYKRLVLLLHRKHMSTALLAPWKPLYNLTDDRLVFGFNGAYIGRDVTERNPAKWFKYHSNNPMDYVYLQGKISNGHEDVVLTEDLFSAIKVRHYTGLSTLCCLGTHVSDAIVAFLTYPRSDRVMYPILAFDGDKAGDKAKRVASTRLGIRGIPFSSVRVPDGLDPKDLNHVELINLFNGVPNHG